VWNGDVIRTGGKGCSGTDTTLLLVAELLASLGHTVDFVINSSIDGMCRGVNFTSKINAPETEILITAPWCFHWCYNILMDEYLPKLKKTIVNMQCVEQGIPMLDYTNRYKNYPIIAVYPSQWTKIAQQTIGWHCFTRDYIVPNPLMSEFLTDITYDRQPSLYWHACFERGGHIAQKVANELSMDFRWCDYNANETYDKKTIMEGLSKSSYFVYPLVLPDNTLHKDTFACCVAEALAMGVIVITWRVAALPEVYEGSPVQFLDPPDEIKERVLNPYFIKEPWFNSDEAVGMLQEAVMKIEADPERQERLRKMGVEFARKKFNCVSEWKSVIEPEKICY